MALDILARAKNKKMERIFQNHDTRACSDDVAALVSVLIRKDVRINSVGRFTTVFDSKLTVQDFCREHDLNEAQEELLCFAAHSNAGAAYSEVSWKAWKSINTKYGKPQRPQSNHGEGYSLEDCSQSSKSRKLETTLRHIASSRRRGKSNTIHRGSSEDQITGRTTTARSSNCC